MTEPPEERSAPPPAPLPGCRVCVVHVGDMESASFEPLIGDPVGPEFTGVPALASDGSVLAVVGIDVDGRLCAWRGQPDSLQQVSERPPITQPVALVHHLGQWHLFGTDGDGRARHCTSDDLVSWHDDQRFVDEHPNLSVRGAAATSSGVVLLGEVTVHGRRMGWTLLEDSEGSLRAREVVFPLTAEHEVVGPAHLGADELALVVVSSTSNLVARSIHGTRGRRWTLGLLSAEITPVVAFGAHGRLWVAGSSPSGDAPMLAQVGGRSFHLGGAPGAVRAAVMHRDSMVIARSAVTVEIDPPTDGWSAGGSQPSTQSSPAYIDSISSA